MLGGALVGPQVSALDKALRHSRQLLLEPGREHRQPHHLDKADVLLLDVVQLRVGVIDPQGVLFRGDVVAQHQVQFKFVSPLPGDGGDGVVGLALRLGVDKRLLVGAAPPCG